MATIVYLDPEDEITSAATRIRTADGTRVGLVLPFGSRVATSRINFRLLAREAQASGRRLDIVAPDTSARALAASAGLPVFSSVGEYEAALETSDEIAGIVDEPVAAGTATAAATAATAATTSTPALGAAAEPAPVERFRPRARVPALDPAQQAEPEDIVARSRPATEDRPRRRRPGVGVIVSFLILGLAVVVSITAAAIVLPAAEITVTPRIEAVGPISITVTADPAASVVDPGTRVIPAHTLEIPVTATGEFAATGKRVEETKAAGVVRFDSINTVGPVSVPRGTRVSTLDGIVFVTDQAVLVPKAKVTGNRIEHGIASVGVTALKAGTGGNVDPGAISQVPGFLSTQQVSVMNPAATKGGARTEFPKVAQSDVEAALEALRTDIAAQFAIEVENPDRVPAGATVFPETAVAGDPIPNVDPSTLVGQEVETFTLGMSATGTVLAVDASPVEAIAEAQLTAAITPGYQLVEGSIRIEVGEGTVTEGLIDFPVTGSARQLRPLDAATLEREILGLSEADAMAALAPYGEIEITLWPGWVTAVPTLDQRVTLSLADPVDSAPTPTPTPTPSPRPTSASTPGVEPGASEDASGSEPVPSG